jgi:transcriptional regulator with XRE-family HTH domain
MSSLPSIDTRVADKLRGDREFRQQFFYAEASAKIAQQLIALRKRRHLNQVQVAEMLATGQSAISRIERADYRNWSFNTLRRLAEAMDARLRVSIEPFEDVIEEYDRDDAQFIYETQMASAAAEVGRAYDQTSLSRSITGSASELIQSGRPLSTQGLKAVGLAIMDAPHGIDRNR